MAENTLSYVKEKMEEDDFYGILTWNAIKATIVMAAILFMGAVGLPFIFGSVQEVPGTYWLSLSVTYVVMLYVFRKKILPKREEGAWTFLVYLATWFLIALVYSVIMYIGGEVIFIGLATLGIFVTVVFLFGDFSLTSVFTYRDLVKWAKKETDKEEKAKKEMLPSE
jgi:hypothetical protein